MTSDPATRHTPLLVLIALDGILHHNALVHSDNTPSTTYDPAILVHIYDAGDCDTPRWPSPDLDVLIGALYADRECGFIPANCTQAVLPDGAVIQF